MTRPPARTATSRTTARLAGTAASVVAVLALAVACSSDGSDRAIGSGSAGSAASDTPSTPPFGLTVTDPPTAPTTPTTPTPASSDPAAPAPPSSADPGPASAASSAASASSPGSPGRDASLPTTIQSVPRGELVAFQVRRQGQVLIDAQSSGLARYNTSASCEVPGQPCYDAPTFDKVARIDLSAAPQVPGTDTTFITGHSNRYQPDSPTKGIFVYGVSTTLSVPFDRLTTTDEVVRVRPNTVIAISCVIAPNAGSYLGNYVVVASLRASATA